MTRALLLLVASAFVAAPQVAERGDKPVVLLSVDGARDVTAEPFAFVELSTARDTYFWQEPIRLRVRFGFDPEFLQKNLIQLFHQPLDVPAQVQAPWWKNLAGTIATADNVGSPSGKQSTFALDADIAQASRAEDRLIDDRRFTVFEIEKDFLPNAAGELSIPAPLLRFAHATRFVEDFVNGRVAADRSDAFVRGKPLLLTILPLPEAGRPADFSGAVGNFSVVAEAAPSEVAVGESVKLALRIEGVGGAGNLAVFDTPRLPELAGFRVNGSVDDKGETRRTITYDLTPQSERVTEVPPFPFTFFDPGPPAEYREVRTQRIPIVVRPAERVVPKSTELGASDASGVKRPAIPDEESPRTRLALWIAGSLLFLSMCAIGLGRFRRARARARRENDPERRRVRAAAAAFRARAAHPDADLAQAFAEFLAALLGCSAAAVISPGLRARLEAKRVPPELSTRAASLLESLVGSRYGGSAPADAAQSTRELVDALEASIRNVEKVR